MKILLFADLHIGAIKDTLYYSSTFSSILQRSIHTYHPDLIVILGDYFDRLFKANEPYVTLSNTILSLLLSYDIPVRLIYGTESHEMNQYTTLFPHYFSHYNLKLYTTVTEETINSRTFLFIPEEYITSKEDHYQSTLYSHHYDYILGHGTINEFLPISTLTNRKHSHQVPIFTQQELSSHSTITAFGHYHIHKDQDNVHYVGSLFRWKFGEEEPKGYALIDEDTFIFIPNNDAYTFNTYEISSNDENEIRSQIQRIQSENPSIFQYNLGGKIKLIFSSDSSPTLYERIRTEALRSNQITTQSHYTPSQEDPLNDPNDPDRNLYEIIMSKSIPPVEKIQRFIEEKHHLNLTPKQIESYIHNTLDV